MCKLDSVRVRIRSNGAPKQTLIDPHRAVDVEHQSLFDFDAIGVCYYHADHVSLRVSVDGKRSAVFKKWTKTEMSRISAENSIDVT